MVWLAAVAAAVVAAAVVLVVVPRITIDDPDAPSLAPLASPTGALLTGAVALLTALVVAPAVGVAWFLWWPYLALGAPLAYVDLRTTWLPKRLNHLAGLAMVSGGAVVAVVDWRLALFAAIGSLAAALFFYLAWRFSGGLGFGDVRLGFLVGAVAGLGGLTGWVTALLAGTILGALHGIGHSVWARRDPSRPSHFPYGPALWLGPIVAALIGR